MALGELDSDEDQISVLMHTYSTRLRVHVFIYINKLFSAGDQLESCKSEHTSLFLLTYSLLLIVVISVIDGGKGPVVQGDAWL